MLSPHTCHGTIQVVALTITPRAKVDPSGGQGAHSGDSIGDDFGKKNAGKVIFGHVEPL
ncbi:hypothetical protein LguiA_005101 [Lonicera macranthoides]